MLRHFLFMMISVLEHQHQLPADVEENSSTFPTDGWGFGTSSGGKRMGISVVGLQLSHGFK
jgi:hypothetical protein